MPQFELTKSQTTLSQLSTNNYNAVHRSIKLWVSITVFQGGHLHFYDIHRKQTTWENQIGADFPISFNLATSLKPHNTFKQWGICGSSWDTDDAQ